MILFQLRKQAISKLREKNPDTAEFEVDHLLKYVLDITSSQLFLMYDHALNESTIEAFNNVLNRRLNYEPLDYIMGSSIFMNRFYHIRPGVLIPRDETELLLLAAKKHISSLFSESFYGIECGFGSGILSIELALSFPDSQWTAYDTSNIAYECALSNAALHKVTSIEWICRDFFSNKNSWKRYKSPFVCISNPPYIPSEDLSKLDRDVKDYEPKEALDGGKCGLVFYKRLLSQAACLQVLFCFECGIGQAEYIAEYAGQLNYRILEIIPDHQHIKRVLCITNLTQ